MKASDDIKINEVEAFLILASPLIVVLLLFLEGIYNAEFARAQKKEDVIITLENPQTICFTQENIGTWCVDKTYKDPWQRKAK